MKHLSAIFGSSFRRISVGITIVRFLRSASSVYIIILVAKYFGASPERAAWVLSQSSVVILGSFFFTPLNETFRAKFVHLRESRGELAAIEHTQSLLALILVISLNVILFVELLPGLLGSLFASGFSVAELVEFNFMLRLCIPLFLLNQIVFIWSAILNVYDTFYYPDLFSVLSVMVNIVAVYLLVDHLGIYSLVVGSYLAVLPFLVALTIKLKEINRDFLFIGFPSWQKAMVFVKFSLPFYLSSIVQSVHLTIERNLCSILGLTSVNIFDYARRFTDVPMNVIFGVTSSVVTPRLAAHAIHQNKNYLVNDFLKFLRMSILGIFPLVILFTVTPTELVRLVLVRGVFTTEFVPQTAGLLFYFGWGLLGVVLFYLSNQAMVSTGKIGLVTKTTILALSCTTFVNVLFFRRVGLELFALSWVIQLFVSAIYLAISIDKQSRKNIASELLKLIGLSLLVYLLSALTKIVTKSVAVKFIDSLIAIDIVVITVVQCAGILFLILALFLFRLEEQYLVTRMFGRMKYLLQSKPNQPNQYEDA